MNPVVYISGAMTGVEFMNRPAFAAAAKRLRDLGYAVINPAETDPPGEPTWAECMRDDIRDMMGCTMLALLPGWEKSKGAQLEVHIAVALKMPVMKIEEYGSPTQTFCIVDGEWFIAPEHGGDLSTAEWRSRE